MRKIGLTLLTLTIALAACGEVPTAASADEARAAMAENPGLLGSGYNEEETTAENPGLAGSGYLTTPDSEWMATAENPGFGGSGN